MLWVTPPPDPVTLKVWNPRAAFFGTGIVMVEVPDPGAEMVLGLKDTPFNVADKVIAELKSPEIAVVIVEVTELPCATLILSGEAEMVNVPDAAGASALIRLSAFGLPQPVARS